MGELRDIPQLSTEPTRLCVEWGTRGSAPVMEEGELAPDNLNRRSIRVWLGDTVEWPCISNVYDERHYFEGVY